MFALLLLLTMTQLPCVQGESTLVCHCKQGMPSACAVLEQSDPMRAADILQALRVLKVGEESAAQPTVEVASGSQGASGAPEPPDCNGQQHHPISRRIATALEEHPVLQGRYQPRDPRFVTRAVDKAAHCGYQEWHRDVDDEVVNWLRTHRAANEKSFEEFLRSIYRRPDMRARFPNGL